MQNTSFDVLTSVTLTADGAADKILRKAERGQAAMQRLADEADEEIQKLSSELPCCEVSRCDELHI